MQTHNFRNLHLQINLYEVFAEDKKQHYCGDIVLGWVDLLFLKPSRIILCIGYEQKQILLNPAQETFKR